MAAANTLCAAKAFGQREKHLMEKISNCEPGNAADKQTDFRMAAQREEVFVYVGHDYQPDPYRRVDMKVRNLPFPLTRYVDLLEAEVHAARAAAG